MSNNPGGRGKINAAEKAMAHRFSKNARRTFESNRNHMRTPGASIHDPQPGEVNIWNQEKWRVLNPTLRNAPEARITQLGSTDSSVTTDERVEGLADVGTANREDQYFDNIAWYKQVYSKIGGISQHGMDLGEVFLDDKFFKWMEKKKEQEFSKNYEIFKLSLVRLDNPPERDYWQKKFPELVEKKLLFYKNRMAILARLNEIKIRGPNGREDLEFIYLYNLGMFNSSTVDEVNTYIADPQDRTIWNAAVNQGVIDWNNVSWNDDLEEPPSTPWDSRAVELLPRLQGAGLNYPNWQAVPVIKHP